MVDFCKLVFLIMSVPVILNSLISSEAQCLYIDTGYPSCVLCVAFLCSIWGALRCLNQGAFKYVRRQ